MGDGHLWKLRQLFALLCPAEIITANTARSLWIFFISDAKVTDQLLFEYCRDLWRTIRVQLGMKG